MPLAVSGSGGRRVWLAAGTLAVMLIFALVPAILYFRYAPPEAREIRFEMPVAGALRGTGAKGCRLFGISRYQIDEAPDGYR